MIDSPNKYKTMLQYCLRHKLDLPSRDADEIDGIAQRAAVGYELTDGQIANLERIYESVAP